MFEIIIFLESCYTITRKAGVFEVSERVLQWFALICKDELLTAEFEY